MKKLGVTVYAASAQTGEDAQTMAKDVSFAIGEAVTQDTAGTIGAWWEGERGFIQPSQFLIKQDGTIVQSTYSDGPLGRMDAADVCGLVNFLKSQ